MSNQYAADAVAPGLRRSEQRWVSGRPSVASDDVALFPLPVLPDGLGGTSDRERSI